MRAVRGPRLAFGAWMTLEGLNYLLGASMPLPRGAHALAAQLLAAFAHSGLLSVAMALKLIGGALLLADLAVPFALAMLMPLSTCALYWAGVLDREPPWALLALLAFALNGLLMLAYLDSYRAMLSADALADGETREANFGTLFVNPLGEAPRAAYPGALIPLLAAAAFYYACVPFASGDYGLLILIVPAILFATGWARKRAGRA